MTKSISNKPGYITTMSAIIVGAISIAVIISFLSEGINSTKNSASNIYAAQARVIAQACGEEAIQRIRDNTSYTGSFNLIFNNGTCSSTVSTTGLPNITVVAQGTSTTVTKKIKIIINQVSPKINISSWQEVADF